jgi:hypothetical protein
MPKETHIFNVKDGNFILKISDKDAVILDAGYGDSKLAPVLELGTDNSVIKSLLKGVQNVHTIISHQHKDHWNLLPKVFSDIKKNAPTAEIHPVLVGGGKPSSGTENLQQAAENIGKDILIHFWGDSGGASGSKTRKTYNLSPKGTWIEDPNGNISNKDVSFKIGDKLKAIFDAGGKATIGGESFAGGALGQEISLGRERISVLTPLKSTDEKNNPNAESLVSISQFRGIKEVFPGDATGKTLEGVKCLYPRAFWGTDLFVSPHHNSRGSHGAKDDTKGVGQSGAMAMLANDERTPDMPPIVAIHSTSRTDENEGDSSTKFQKAYNPSTFQKTNDAYVKELAPVDFNAIKAPLDLKLDKRGPLDWSEHGKMVTFSTAKLGAGGEIIAEVRDEGSLQCKIEEVGPIDPLPLAGKFTPDMLKEIIDKSRLSKKTKVLVEAFDPERVSAVLADKSGSFRPKKTTWIPKEDVRPKAAGIINDYKAKKSVIGESIKSLFLSVNTNEYLSALPSENFSEIGLESVHHVELPLELKDVGLSQDTMENIYRVVRRDQKGYRTEQMMDDDGSEKQNNVRSLYKILGRDKMFGQNMSVFLLENFTLSKDKILRVPNKIQSYLPFGLSGTPLQTDCKSAYGNLNGLAKMPVNDLKRELSIVFGPTNSSDTFAEKLFWYAKLLSKVKKTATGDLLNLASPLVDPYVKSNKSGVSNKVPTTFRLDLNSSNNSPPLSNCSSLIERIFSPSMKRKREVEEKHDDIDDENESSTRKKIKSDAPGRASITEGIGPVFSSLNDYSSSFQGDCSPFSLSSENNNFSNAVDNSLVFPRSLFALRSNNYNSENSFYSHNSTGYPGVQTSSIYSSSVNSNAPNGTDRLYVNMEKGGFRPSPPPFTTPNPDYKLKSAFSFLGKRVWY